MLGGPTCKERFRVLGESIDLALETDESLHPGHRRVLDPLHPFVRPPEREESRQDTVAVVAVVARQLVADHVRIVARERLRDRPIGAHGGWSQIGQRWGFAPGELGDVP